ncbi:hypothetical protein BsWGS_17521 [Bradybaena similaris]
MIRRIKKTSKAGEPDVDALSGEWDSGAGHASRGVLAALDERISDLERHSRGRTKRKHPGNHNTCSSRRPNSVPSKTVSFSPNIRHRENDDVRPESRAAKWNNKCRYCNNRGRRSTMSPSPGRQRSAVNKSMCSDWDNSCQSPSSLSDSPELYTDVSNSPGPARHYRDFRGSAGDHKHSWRPDTAGSRHADDHDLSSASAYYNKRFGWVYPLSCSSRSSYGSSQVSRSLSDERLRYRTNRLSHCFGGEDVLGYESKADHLLAKYSDYSCPTQQSPPMNVFPYKSSFLESLMAGESNNKKSILSKLDILNTSLATLRHSKVKNPLLSCSLPSRYTSVVSRYRDAKEPTDYIYNKSMNSSNDSNLHAPLLTSFSLTSDPLLDNKRFKVYRQDYPILPTIASTNSDSDVKAKFDRWIKPWFDKQSTTFQSKYSSLLLGLPLSFRGVYSQKPLNEMSLHEKYQRIVHNTSKPSRPNSLSSMSSLAVCYNSTENNRSQTPAETRSGRSSRKCNPHVHTETDSMFNYKLNSSRSVVSDLALQQTHSTIDISKRPPSNVNASRASFGSSTHSLDSMFSASTKHCATESGYMRLLKFEKSYLDKFDLPPSACTDTCAHAVSSETENSVSKWKGEDTELVKINFSSHPGKL